MAEPIQRPPKPKLYKFVTVPRVTSTGGATIRVGSSTITGGGAGPAAASMIKAMNSLGATINSVAIITESIAKQTSKTIATEIRQQSELVRRQEKLRKEKIKRDREKEDIKRKKSQRDRDADAEKKSEGLGKFFKNFTKMTTAAAGSFFAGIAQLFEAIFKGLVVYSVLDWLSKPGNIGKLQVLIKGFIGIFRVFKRLIDFGVSSMLEGLVKIIDNPISFKGLFGLVQFMVGSAVLFKALSWIKNPAKLAEDLFGVMKFLAKGIVNLKKGVGIYGKIKKFAGTRAGKYAMAGAVGAGAGIGSALLGGTKEEAIGTGIGAGAGALAGEMLGDRFGPAGGAAGAAAGSLVGGLLGGQVGKALKPVTDAIGKFFKLIGDVLKPAFDFVGNIGKEFFQAVGDLIQSVVSFIEPHKETLGAIAKVSLIVAFGPLIALMKAITWVIRLFVPKGRDTENGSAGAPKRSFGGKVVVPQMAVGGPLVGPSTDFVDPITSRLKQALQDAMLLPFRAVGTGLVSAFGLIGSIFGAFLPGPMQAFLGGVLAPIASVFGVPNSVFRRITGIAMKGINGVAGAVVEGAGGVLEKLMGGDNETSVTGILRKILGAMVKLHEKNNGTPPGKAIGGVVPQAARGGWISGPMSGYPVSLDGGRSTAFIGHGTEWVGFKNRAAGGGAGSAFVVPFHTPATVRTPSLTSMRMTQARSGGFAMPKFAAGGKFDPYEYDKGMKSSYHITNPGNTGKTFVVGYTVNDAEVTIKQLNKLVEKGNLVSPDKLTGVKPGSDEWKAVMGSAETVKYFKNHAVPAIKASKLKIKVDPKADIYYGYKQAYSTTYDKWKSQGADDQTARNYANAAAREFAIAKNGASRLPGTKGGLDAKLADVQVAGGTALTTTSSSASTATDIGSQLAKAFSDYRSAFGMNETSGDNIDKQSGKTKDAQEEATKARLQEESSKISAAASQLATSNSKTQKPPTAPPTVVNPSGNGAKPTADINPFLRSKFGLIAQTAFDPSLTLF